MNQKSNPGTLSSDRIDLLLISNIINPNSNILDVGCGEGDLLALLSKEKQINGRGLELSQAGVNSCVARGLSVVQGNADTDLEYYPDNGFDYVILSQTLQATKYPDLVLKQLARIGKKLVVSIPNFGHWRIRLNLLWTGRMPKTKTLDADWYNTGNIHLCSLLDFTQLCSTLNLHIEKSILLTPNGVKEIPYAPTKWHNLWTQQAVFLLSHQ